MADTASLEKTGTVSGGVRTLLRLEGLTLFAGMTSVYGFWGEIGRASCRERV